MNISYKRNMEHNYLVFNRDTYNDDYQIGMITKNRIPGLLECSAGRMNGEISLYYEITSKQNLGLLLERKRLSGNEIAKLLEGILQAVQSCGEYLLDVHNLLLSPEFIYLDPDEWTVYLCLDPLLETTEENPLQSLAEYLLEHIDRQDPGAVSLGYEFYRIAGEENPSLNELVRSWKENQLFRYDNSSTESDTDYERVSESADSHNKPSEVSPNTEREKFTGDTACLSGTSAPGILLHSQHPSYPDFRITTESFVIGKKKDSVDGFIKARGISRLHGRISKEGEYYYITDLNSTNGIYLNGGRLDVHEKAKLRSGDCLSFAGVKYVVEM